MTVASLVWKLIMIGLLTPVLASLFGRRDVYPDDGGGN